MSDCDEIWRLSACELSLAYREGSLTPTEVIDACLARVDEVNPSLNAVVHRRDEMVRQEACESTRRYQLGAPLSLLDGVPITIKDSLLTKDMPTTWGCRSLRNHQTNKDELPVERVRKSGGLILGKTNVCEFTLEGYTSNTLFGTTRNPWNPKLTPGGSSGGAAAAVAAGMGPLALGADAGGSIRRPASHTGIVGFKPSQGSVARLESLPSVLLDFDVVGPMARTVGDVQLLFDVIKGPIAGDRHSFAAHAQGKPVPSSLRVLYVPTLEGAPVDPEIARACRAAALSLSELGHKVVEGTLPLDLGFMTTQWPIVGQIGLAWLFTRFPEWCREASPKYIQMAAIGAEQSATRLWDVLDVVQETRRNVASLFNCYDLIVMPTAAALPWAAETAFPSTIDGKAVGPRGHAIFTSWVNAAGLPAISVPAGFSANGLPIGIQIVGDYGTDDALLDTARTYEKHRPWAECRPDLRAVDHCDFTG